MGFRSCCPDPLTRAFFPRCACHGVCDCRRFGNRFRRVRGAGRFPGGMVVGRTSVSHQAAEDLLPMRDAFAVLFFLSVGMLFNPALLWVEPLLVLAGLAVVLVVTPFTAALVVILAGGSTRTALTVALGLAQIGEFSFILAQQARQVELMSDNGYSLLVAIALVSIAVNPLLFRLVDPLEGWLQGRPRLWAMLNRRTEEE